jgi:hypothetical protein
MHLTLISTRPPTRAKLFDFLGTVQYNDKEKNRVIGTVSSRLAQLSRELSDGGIAAGMDAELAQACRFMHGLTDAVQVDRLSCQLGWYRGKLSSRPWWDGGI